MSRQLSNGAKKEMGKMFEWIRSFGEMYALSRIHRALDVVSDDVKKAQKLARAYIGEGNHDFFATCVDGRNMPTVMFTKPPHVGGVLRAPAGALTGFMEGQKSQSVFIDDDSFVVKQIQKLLIERAGETIFYGLDSHLGCAARGLIHSTEGGKQLDAGLRSDVKSKLMTARGIIQLREKLVSNGVQAAEVIPVFFSYDPHSGGVVSGLEMYVDDPQVSEEGYTDSILDTLAIEGKIIRTIDLLEDPEILQQLNAVIQPSSSNFEERFAQSMLANWKAVTSLYDGGAGVIFEKILKLLVQAYTKGEWIISDHDNIQLHQISKRAIKQKAKFLLKNLLTRYSIAGASHKWPYGNHKEDMVVITDGGYAPFEKINAFAVFSRDLNALLPNTKLTIDLIRGFRKSGGIVDPVVESKLSAEEFWSAPVLITNKAVFRQASDKACEVMENVDLASVFSNINWDDTSVLSWKKSDIADLLLKVHQVTPVSLPMTDSLGYVDVLFELFDRMRIMMKDKYFRHMILNGNIVILNLIVDADRKPIVIVPFVI